TFDHDIHGNLSCVTDAEGHATEYLFDDRNRLIETTSPDTGDSHDAYNEADLMVQSVDGNGTVLNYQHDALGRLTHVEDGDGNNAQSYTYDDGTDVWANHGIGRQGSATGSGITATRTYDMD